MPQPRPMTRLEAVPVRDGMSSYAGAITTELDPLSVAAANIKNTILDFYAGRLGNHNQTTIDIVRLAGDIIGVR
jgi:hypothetical protein